MQYVNNRFGFGPKQIWLKRAFLLLGWLLVLSLARGLWQTRRGFQRVSFTESRLKEVESKHQDLVLKLERVGDESFKERLIRERLNMQKPGEVVVIMPELTKENESMKEKESLIVPNWNKWWALIK